MNAREAISKSLFLLGAGASYDAKCKMSNEMLKDLQNRITSKSDTTFELIEKETLQFLLSCLEYQNKWRSLESDNDFVFTPNIEELALVIRRIRNRENFLPYPITGNWADKLIRLETEFASRFENSNLFDSIERKIKSVLIREWLHHDNTDFLSPLKTFFEESPSADFKLDIVSLNYDLVIEDYFEQHNMPPWRGFSNNVWRGLSSDVPKEFGRINLYKIHGSLDWVRLISGEVRLRSNLEDVEQENIDSQHDPYIVFGYGTKTFSVDPFFSLIHDFKELLRNRDYIFAIGYSFFDPYINNLLLEAVNYGAKKLIIVNPSFGPNELSKKLKVNSKLENFFEGRDERGNSENKTLIAHIERIQKNPFYSEVPEFNVSRISGETSVFYMPIGTKVFLTEFFRDRASLFTNLIDEFDKEDKTDEPFS